MNKVGLLVCNWIGAGGEDSSFVHQVRVPVKIVFLRIRDEAWEEQKQTKKRQGRDLLSLGVED